MPNLLSKVVSDGTTHVTDATTSPASDDATGKPEGTPGTVKTYDEKTFKEVVGQRDELKKRLIKLEEDAKKREETALTEQGKFKELAERHKSDLDKALTENASLKTIVDQVKADKESQLKELLKPLSKEDAELVSGMPDLDAQIRIARRLTTEKQKAINPPGVTSGKISGTGIDYKLAYPSMSK